MSKLSAAERIRILIFCPICSKGTEKSLAWLVGNKTVPCGTFGCRTAIDLDLIENRILIEEGTKYAASAEARLSQGD